MWRAQAASWARLIVKVNCRRTNVRLQATWETHSQQRKRDVTPSQGPNLPGLSAHSSLVAPPILLQSNRG